MIKMAQIEHIKKMYFLEELSIREISKITGQLIDKVNATLPGKKGCV